MHSRDKVSRKKNASPFCSTLCVGAWDGRELTARFEGRSFRCRGCGARGLVRESPRDLQKSPGGFCGRGLLFFLSFFFSFLSFFQDKTENQVPKQKVPRCNKKKAAPSDLKT